MAKIIKKGAPPWMATFADLCTLMLTFFVLLLTFASMDIQKFREMLGSVRQAFGVQFEVQGEFQPAKPPPTLARPTLTRPETPIGESPTQRARDAAEATGMANQIKQVVDQAGMSQMVDVSSGQRGVRLRIKGRLLFAPGQATVLPEARNLLKGVAQVMKRFSFYLTVEGHTDNTPISTSRFPSNWDLSSARAAAVLRYLVSLGVPARRVSAVGHASNYPMASNATAEGRERNRRVEFVFTKRPPRVGVD